MVGNATLSDPGFAFERTARQDLRWWGLFVVGLIFWWMGMSVDPAGNCSADGECAPWLVPLAAGMGVLALLGGGAMLIANPRRGSRVDSATATLYWWQGRRLPRYPGESGSVALGDIKRIRIVTTSESDSIFFYGDDGLLPLPDGEAWPWPYQDWAQRLAAAYPHIEVVVISE
jgi:hypothetical protein